MQTNRITKYVLLNVGNFGYCLIIDIEYKKLQIISFVRDRNLRNEDKEIMTFADNLNDCQALSVCYRTGYC